MMPLISHKNISSLNVANRGNVVEIMTQLLQDNARTSGDQVLGSVCHFKLEFGLTAQECTITSKAESEQEGCFYAVSSLVVCLDTRLFVSLV